MTATSPGEPLRIGLIGAGSRGVNGWGRMLASRADARLVAIAEPNGVRARAAARTLGSTFAIHADARAMLGSEALDGVIIASPDWTHDDLAVAALQAGVAHILVEKPLATTVEGCLSVARAEARSGGRVSVGFNMRHLPFIARVKQLVVEGAIGELMMIENREFYDGGRTYMARWNGQSRLSGGLWVHKGSHDFDVFNWWNQAGTPTRVSASAGLNALRSDKIPFPVRPDVPVGPSCSSCAYADICPDFAPPIGGRELFSARASEEDGYVQDACVFLSDKDTHDNGIALVEYSNNVRASHMECFACGFTDRLYTIVGTRGVLVGQLSRAGQIELRPRWGQSQIIPVEIAGDDEHGGSDALLLDNFLASIRVGTGGSSGVRDGLRAVAVGQAAEVAWREGRTVQIGELVDLAALG